MRQEQSFHSQSGLLLGHPTNVTSKSGNHGKTAGISALVGRLPRQAVLGLILIVALLAFEIFNFDTTRYALTSLLGEVSFLGIGWAAILAIAFCAIDFAGLAHLFTPERGRKEPKEVWYLMGAWLLGATMNALMTWWAISVTLLNHEFGNEVLSREQLLTYVPVFVAVLVWLTRILFIGAISVAGDHLFSDDHQSAQAHGTQPAHRPQVAKKPTAARRQGTSREPTTDELPGFLEQEPLPAPVRATRSASAQRPARPYYGRRPASVAARGRRR